MIDDINRQAMLENLRERFYEDDWSLCVELARHMTDQEMKRIYNIICLQHQSPIEREYEYVQESEKPAAKLEQFLESKGMFTPPEVAGILGVTGKTIRRYIRDGKIKSIKSPTGNRNWIPGRACREFFEDQGLLN